MHILERTSSDKIVASFPSSFVVVKNVNIVIRVKSTADRNK